jgi:hypothetical protein
MWRCVIPVYNAIESSFAGFYKRVRGVVISKTQYIPKNFVVDTLICLLCHE